MDRKGVFAISKSDVYVVRVITGRERETVREINALRRPIKAFNPLSALNKPVFPGYIFVKMHLSGDTYYTVLNMPYTLYFLSPAYGAFPITKDEELRVKGQRQSLIGLRVKVVRGKCRGVNGTIRGINYPEIIVDLPFSAAIPINIKHLVLLEDGLPKGTPVKITSGVYSGMSGVVEEANGAVALVKAQAFGTEALIECSAKHLSAI